MDKCGRCESLEKDLTYITNQRDLAFEKKIDAMHRYNTVCEEIWLLRIKFAELEKKYNALIDGGDSTSGGE